MATNSDNSNQKSRDNHDAPATSEQPKAGLKPTGVTADEEERLADEYTEDGLDAIPANLQRNPNRSYNKPDIDKPPYS